MIKEKINFVFFGSSEFSIFVLDELEKLGLLPEAIITTPDKPKGRGLETLPTPVKVWAFEHKIPCLSPIKLDSNFAFKLSTENYKLFLVASYGKIIPENIFNLPTHKTLNIHPSFLPEYRGASPVQTAILENKQDTGVTIIQIDKEMDHGPIVVQKRIKIDSWPINTLELKKILATEGVKMFADIISDWISGKIKAIPQDETKATYTKKIDKNDAEINMSDDHYKNLLKTKAYSMWPKAYYFHEKDNKKIRVIIKDAEIRDEKFVPTIVIPEGKKEMSFDDFLRGLKKNPNS